MAESCCNLDAAGCKEGVSDQCREAALPPQGASQGPQEPTAQTFSLQALGLHVRCRGAGCPVALQDATSAALRPSPAPQMAAREAVPPPHCTLQLP